MGIFRKKPGKALNDNRLQLEDSLEFYRNQVNVLQDNYNEQMQLYEKLLEQGESKSKDATIMLQCANSTKDMLVEARAQYTEALKTIGQISEVAKRDSDMENGKIGTAVGVGTAFGSMALGYLSYKQAVVTDNEGLMVRKNVKHFFDSVNPIRILRDRH